MTFARALGLSIIAVACFGARPASARSPYLIVPDAKVAEASPAYRYANMRDDEAYAALDQRKIPYKKADPLRGVRAPVRLTGRLHGVLFRTELPAAQRETSLFEVLDARLALALDDFAALLEKRGFDEVIHYNMYRPTSPTPSPPGTRHPAGLAIDVAKLKRRDGRWLSVAQSFHGKLGEKTCGQGARVPSDADARELRAVACEPAERNVFTYVLTPNFDAAHRDHYHMEIKPGVKWFLSH